MQAAEGRLFTAWVSERTETPPAFVEISRKLGWIVYNRGFVRRD